MAARINVNFILKSIGVLAAAVLIVFAAGKILYSTAMSDVLPKAQKLIDAEKYLQAVELYQAHLKENPDDVDALLALAELQLKLRKPTEALTNYRKVNELEPNNKEALTKLASFQYVKALAPSAEDAAERWTEVEKFARQLIKIDSESSDGYKFLAIALLNPDRKGNAEQLLQREQEAEKLLQDITKKMPAEEWAYFSLASHLVKKKESPEKWLPYIQLCVKNNPESPSAHLKAYQFLKEQNQPNAQDYLAQAAKVAPEDPDVLAQLAGTEEEAAREADDQAAQQHLNRAAAFWQKLKKVAPADPRSYSALARLAWTDENGEKAIEIMKDGLKNIESLNDEVFLRYRLSEMLIALNRPDDLRTELTRLRIIAPNSPWVSYLEGYYQLAKSHYDEAREPLARVDTFWSGAYNNITDQLRKSDLSPAKIKNLQQEHYRLKQQLSHIKMMLSTCYFQLQRPGLARDILIQARDVFQQNNSNAMPAQYNLALARAQLACGNPANAMNLCRQALAEQPENAQALALQAQAYATILAQPNASADTLPEAITAAEQAAKQTPNAQTLGLLAALYARAGNLAEAESTLQQKLDDPDQQQQLTLRLAAFYRSHNQPQKAVEAIKNLKANDIRTKLIALQFTTKPEELEQKLQDMLKTVKADDARTVRLALAQHYITNDNAENAYNILKSIADDELGNAAIRRTMLSISLQQKDFEKALTLLDEVGKIEGGDTPRLICDRAEYTLAMLADDASSGLTPAERTKELVDTSKQLQVICDTTPSPRSWRLLAQANEMNTNVPEAIRCYSQSLKANPRQMSTGLKLVKLLQDNGRQAEAQTALDELLRAIPSPAILEPQFSWLMNEGKYEEAIEVKRTQSDMSPDNPQFQLELGQLLVQQRRTAEAEKHLRNAYDLAPETPAAVQALATLLVRTDRQQEGLALCDELVAAKPEDTAALLCRARVNRAAGNLDKAEQDYQSILTNDPENIGAIISIGDLYDARGDQKTAFEWYRKATAHEPPGSLARKLFAQKLIDTGNPQHYVEADKIADQLLKEDANDQVAYLIKSNMALLNAGNIPQAREFCQQAINLNPKAPEPHFQMSRIHQAQNDLRQALEEASLARFYAPSSRKYIMNNVNLLLRTSRTAEASALISDLGNSPDVAIQKAGIIAQERGPAAAAQSLSAVLGNLPAGTPDAAKAVLLQQIGTYLATAGNNQAAEQHLREAFTLSGKSTSAASALALFYEKTKRPAQADQILGDLITEADANKANDLKLFYADLLRSRQSKDSLAQAAHLANEVATARPDSTNALRLLGDISYMQGNVQKAIDYLRRALNADARNTLAANNLAWMLAETGNPKDALPFAQKAVALAPSNANFHDTLGEVYYNLGNYKESERSFRRCLQLNPQAAASRYRLARVLYKQDKKAEAATEYQRALKLNEQTHALTADQVSDCNQKLQEIEDNK